MSREEVIKLALRISEIRAEISRLAGLQRELRSLEATMDGMLGIEPTVHDGNIDERIYQLLRENRFKDFSPEEVADTLQLKLSTTRSILSRLLRDRLISKTSRGRYQFSGKEDNEDKAA